MPVPPAGLIDTSVLIARETGRPIGPLPTQVATSVVTLAELRAGVLAAPDPTTRARRLRTLEGIADLVVLPIDEAVAQVWADMRAHLATTGRRVNVNDVWIAATAAAHGLPVVTQDSDFDAVEGVAGLTIHQV
jgi:predicted nucleic acid-binding protein